MKLIEKIVEFLYNRLVKGNGKINEHLKGIHPESFFPYDLVVTNEDYEKLMKQGHAGTADKPIIGMILGVEKYDLSDRGTIPTIVKVYYFNMLNCKYPIIKQFNTKDLRFIASPLNELIAQSGITQEMNEILKEFEDLNSIPNLQKLDPEDEDGGPIIQ